MHWRQELRDTVGPEGLGFRPASAAAQATPDVAVRGQQRPCLLPGHARPHLPRVCVRQECVSDKIAYLTRNVGAFLTYEEYSPDRQQRSPRPSDQLCTVCSGEDQARQPQGAAVGGQAVGGPPPSACPPTRPNMIVEETHSGGLPSGTA